MRIGVVYGSVSIPGTPGQRLLESAVNQFVQLVGDSAVKVIWSLRYTQEGRSDDSLDVARVTGSHPSNNIICFPPPSLDLAFDDTMIDQVKAVWKMIMGGDAADEEFMSFEDREGAYDEE